MGAGVSSESLNVRQCTMKLNFLPELLALFPICVPVYRSINHERADELTGKQVYFD